MTQVLILAAGRGVRMDSAAPKVLAPIAGRPMIRHLLDAVEASGVCREPAVVIGHKADDVRAALGPHYRYIEQIKQLGTGHAVRMCREALGNDVEYLLVLYGDHPFIAARTIRKLAAEHAAAKTAITMMTTRVEDFEDWRSPFLDFGRILRDSNGNVCAVIEKKDATDAVLQVREVNPGLFCFTTSWLWGNIHRLENRNKAHEYYLPDLIPLAIRDGQHIHTLSVDPLESIGINTPEQLRLAERIIAGRSHHFL
jgi:bifunctional UDP-N-acetylglucosamine pyrophosphorylase/glucosamine-1-phosphate N-acetyltransferase